MEVKLPQKTDIEYRAYLNRETGKSPLEDDKANYFHAMHQLVAEEVWKQKGCPANQTQAEQKEDYLKAIELCKNRNFE